MLHDGLDFSFSGLKTSVINYVRANPTVSTLGGRRPGAGTVARLGVANPKALHGGIARSATWPQMWGLNLHIRTATRILVRVARFEAERFDSLQRVLRALDWAAWIPPDRGLRVSVTSSGSKLFHTDAVAERVLEVVPHRPDTRCGSRSPNRRRS